MVLHTHFPSMPWPTASATHDCRGGINIVPHDVNAVDGASRLRRVYRPDASGLALSPLAVCDGPQSVGAEG